MSLKIFLSATLLFCTTILTNAQTPKTYIWNSEQLKKVKTSLSESNSKYQQQVKALLRDADKELTKPEPTVVDKPMCPPSGDKHDYMSLGRYWWPNPDTPDNLPYIRKDGYSNPELEKFDRQRLGTMSTSITKLTIAYVLSDKSNYARKAASIIRTWFLDPKTRMNPNMNYGQTVPGHNKGMGRAEGVIDTYSLVNVVDAIVILSHEGYLSKKEISQLEAWFGEYATWMSTNEIGIGEKNAKNNHGLAYDVQLTIFALFSNNKELAIKTIEQFPSRRLATQIDANGKQPYELARTTGFGYSTFNLTHMLDMCFLASGVGVDIFNSENGSITRAIKYLIQFMGNKAAFSYKQIKSWEEVESDLAQQLMRAHKFCPSDEYLALYDKYKVTNLKDYLFTIMY